MPGSSLILGLLVILLISSLSAAVGVYILLAENPRIPGWSDDTDTEDFEDDRFE